MIIYNSNLLLILMGDMHSKAIFELEGRQPNNILILSIFTGGFATIIASFL